MSDYVGKRFLHNPVDRYRQVPADLNFMGMDYHAALDPGPLPELLYLPLNRSGNAEMIENIGSEFCTDPSDRLDSRIDKRQTVVSLCEKGLFIVWKPVPDPEYVHLQSCKRQAQLVMDFSGELGPFFFSGRLQVSCQSVELFARILEFLFRLLAYDNAGKDVGNRGEILFMLKIQWVFFLQIEIHNTEHPVGTQKWKTVVAMRRFFFTIVTRLLRKDRGPLRYSFTAETFAKRQLDTLLQLGLRDPLVDRTLKHCRPILDKKYAALLLQR